MTSFELTAPSGNTLHYRSESDEAIVGVCVGVTVIGPKFHHAFTVGPRGYHSAVTAEMEPADLVARDLYDGCELLVSRSREGQATLATVCYPDHEVNTVFGGDPPSVAQIFWTFSQMVMKDAPSGVRFAAPPGSASAVAWEEFTITLEGKPILSVPGAGSAAVLIPTSAGAPTRYGEVWREEMASESLPGVSDLKLTLGFRSAAAEVIVWHKDIAAVDGVLAWLDGLELAWVAG